MPRFAELLGKSCFSFLEGASRPDELLARSHQLGQFALALCDRNGLYGSARLHVAHRELLESHGNGTLNGNGNGTLNGNESPCELVNGDSVTGNPNGSLIGSRNGHLIGNPNGHGAGNSIGNHAGNPNPGGGRLGSPPRLIVGAELTLTAGLELAPQSRGKSREPDVAEMSRTHRGLPSVALLCESAEGYATLCRLLTRAHSRKHPHAQGKKGQARLDVRELVADSAGLFAIVPLEPRARLASDDLAVLRDGFGERCAIAVWRHLDDHDGERMEAALTASRALSLPIVASARPLFHARARKPLADVLACIRHKTTLDRAGTRLLPNAEAELASPERMARLFPGQPEWLSRSVTIAERCHFSLAELRYRFPSDYGDRALSPDENLRRAVACGAVRRYPEGVPHEVQQQLARELGLIAELEVAPYFLSVQQIVEIARERRILCQGRGSAANSAVCYVLGITAVDPVKGSLLFERFMSTARREPPDIDVDFEHERREEVIQEIYRRYGRTCAAMVCEVICYRHKSALREVGKVMGLSAEQLELLSGLASHHEDGPIAKTALSKRGLDPTNHRLALVLRLVEELAGFPRHLSIHVGGFILSSEPLTQVAPIEPASMRDRTIVPWDKDDLDALGFFKVDVLGLGILTAIRKALASVHELRHGSLDGFDPIEALARIPPEDRAVYEAACRADTVGVFQIESRAQMAMLPVLAPRKFYDLVVQVGIVRPGPIQGGMVHPYLRRRTGDEPVSYPHASLEPILQRTLGVPLFQEQVMQIAIVGAGYSPGEADQLRRDMAAWKKHGRLARHREQLLAGFRARGISSRFGEALYKQIHGFGEYGFPESHAASFALLVYASLWLKVHHPAAFVCALLNSQPMGFYSPSSLVRDAKEHGVSVYPVRVEQSAWDATLEPEIARHDDAAEARPRQALRLGLRQVRGLARGSVELLVRARARGSFADLDELARRSGLRRDELERLADAGALEGLVPSRREALWQLRAPREGGLYDGRAIEPPSPANLPPLGKRAQLALDYGTLGLSLDDHPLRHLRRGLARRRVRPAKELASAESGTRVSVAGLVLMRQRPVTAKGIIFFTLEDETGIVNLVVYAHVFERYELAARHGRILLARGLVDRRGTVVHVRADYLERLDLEGTLQGLRSRDFH
ncbi:MAG: DNA polymerase III subunit alpha [Myxococcales bacterium]|nr:DNA polymerase III subunit alpha [Myxococcales bacterium]